MKDDLVTAAALARAAVIMTLQRILLRALVEWMPDRGRRAVALKISNGWAKGRPMGATGR